MLKTLILRLKRLKVPINTNLKEIYQYGTCIDREYETFDIIPEYDGPYTMLGDIIVKDSVPKEFYVDKEALKRWKEEKGGYTRGLEQQKMDLATILALERWTFMID